MKALELTETALRNHEAFFPNHESKLRQTDPEFIELFDNWAFDEVVQQTKLDLKTRATLILASTIGCQALGEYRVMVGAALNVGVPPVEIKEVLYHAVPYVGVARAFDFIHVTNDALQARGIELPLPEQSTTSRENRFERGVAAQNAIFGDAVEKMRHAAAKDQAHIYAFLATNCFGGYYTRGGLDLKTRELLTFVFLISLGGCEPQVRSHIAGNVRIGNDRARLIDVVTQLLPYIGYPRALNALRGIDEITTQTKSPTT